MRNQFFTTKIENQNWLEKMLILKTTIKPNQKESKLLKI